MVFVIRGQPSAEGTDATGAHTDEFVDLGQRRSSNGQIRDKKV